MNKQINTKLQIEEMEKFLSSANHLKIVLDNLENKDKADKNDIYDLVYNKQKIEEWLKLDIQNNDIKDDLQDILNRITDILRLMSDEFIENTLSSKVKNPVKLNKAKYGEEDKFKDLKDSGNRRRELDTIKGLKEYLSLRASKLCAIIILAIMIIFIPNVFDMMTNLNKLETTNTEQIEVENETDTETDISQLENTEVQSVDESLNSLLKVLSSLIIVMITIVLVMLTMGIVLDVMYIFSNRSTGGALKSLKLISNEALEVENNLEVINIDAKINSKDRLEVAQTLLNNMLQYTRDLKHFVLIYAFEGDLNKNEATLKEINELNKKLKDIQNRIRTKYGIDKLNAYVEAEILYENIEDSMKSLNKIIKSREEMEKRM